MISIAIVQKKKTGEMFAAKCVSLIQINISKPNLDENEPFQ